MTTWTDEELRRIGEAQELQLASARRDGTMLPYTTMWVVRAGDDLYVRSAYGPDNPWFRRAKASGAGRIRAGGVERDVAYAEAAETTCKSPGTPPTRRPVQASGLPAPSTSIPSLRRRGHRACRAASVHFTPGARTAWHTHPLGQTIYVTEDVGLCERRDASGRRPGQSGHVG
jgi:Uncharacterized protein conserved in bacteria (DUF2255)